MTLELDARAPVSVGGYNLSDLAAGADLLWVSADENGAPLAAAWQRGAGRVVALTVEADGRFSGELASWSGYQQFFRAAAEWLKRGEDLDAAVDLRTAGHRAVVTLEVEPGVHFNEQPSAYLFAPTATRPLRVLLRWVGPSQLRGEVALESDGVYHGVVSLPGRPPLPLPPRVLPYSPEFAPNVEKIDGERVLQRLAAATGGGAFTHVDQLLEPRAGRGAARSLALWLITLALAGAVLDVGNRRGLWDPALAGLTRVARALPVPRLRIPLSRRVGRVTPEEPAVAEKTVAVSTPAGEEETRSVLARAKDRARRRM